LVPETTQTPDPLGHGSRKNLDIDLTTLVDMKGRPQSGLSEDQPSPLPPSPSLSIHSSHDRGSADKDQLIYSPDTSSPPPPPSRSPSYLPSPPIHSSLRSFELDPELWEEAKKAGWLFAEEQEGPGFKLEFNSK
jgi:hypothetical protein